MINRNDKKILSFGMDYTEVKPEFSFIRRGTYIPWGKDNLYPDFIYGLRKKSTMHSRILESKKQLIGGMGWSEMGIDPEVLKNSDSNDDLNDVLLKMGESISECGGVFLKVYWNQARTGIIKVECLPWQQVRIVCPDDDVPTPDKIEYFLVSEYWSLINRFRPSKYNIYNPEKKWEEPVQIYYWKQNEVGFYPEPTWLSAVESILLEDKLDRFHLKSVMNGFHLGKFITFPHPGRQLTDEEKMIASRQIRDSFEGEENANKNFIWYAEDKDHVPVIQELGNASLDNSKYITLQNERINQAIMTAHGVTNPVLFAIKTPGQLGGSKEAIDALNTFQSLVVSPIQKICSEIFDYILPQEEDWAVNHFKIYQNLEIGMGDVIMIVNDPTLNPEQKLTLLEMGGLNPDMIKKLLTTNE